MNWEVPSHPEEPRGEPTLELVVDAFLSKVEHGPLASVGRPDRYLRGAVYDQRGKLVKSSQKIGGLHDNPWVTADADSIFFSRNARPLAGRWLYGGHWMQHFGHFITETITTLWPSRQPVEGIVFHKYHRLPIVQEDWMLRLLELAGHGGQQVEVVGKQRAVRVDELVVPSRTVVASGWALPEARRVWDKVASSFRGGGGPHSVYLSRTLFNSAIAVSGGKPRTSPERDRALDRRFADAGFEVIYPETLTVEQQLQAVAGAELLAGASGSALHLSAFAPRGAKVIELGDPRNATKPLRMQLIIDSVSGHPHKFFKASASPESIANFLASNT